MHIIKLDAIGSTNSFLKDLVSNNAVENYTVVTTESQTNGRGQMGATWASESGKNLIFSVFVEFSEWKIEDAVYLNYVVSLAVFKVLNRLELPKLCIKWPNDILSENKKICGILLENSINSEFLKSSVIGIGINVNQENFTDNLRLASSIKNISGTTQNRTLLLKEIVSQLKEELNSCTIETFGRIKEEYLAVLYKYLKPSMFENNDGCIFMGKIIGVSSIGNLEIEIEDGSIQIFGLKEVRILR
jgi:BirA family biotin operon repressor/biotin-[acetyl-CoA-carboxylase] ligase